MKKKIKKVWNNFLIVSIPISIIGTIFWTCCLDSKSILPIIMLGVNVSWLLLLVEANKDEKETKNEITDNEDYFEEFQRRIG